MPSLRTTVNLSLGTALLIGICVAFFPFMRASMQMKHFCSELPMGAGIAQVQARAADHGYQLMVNTANAKEKYFVTEPISFWRRNCDLKFDAKGLVSAVYSTDE